MRRLLLSPAQEQHFKKGRDLFFSPEAVALRSDPDLGPAQKTAMLDYYFGGWKNLEPRYGKKDVKIYGDNGELIREGKNELPGFNLANDDPIELDAQEVNDFQRAETLRFMQEGEQKGAFATLTDDEIAYVQQVLEEELSGGAIDKIGELGTKERYYPKDYADPELAGTKIPAVFEEGQKRARGLKLLTDVIQSVDTDTGAGTYGMSKDALHRAAAANNPGLLTDIGNIRIGNSSLNQSVKQFEGEQLESALDTRLNRLNEEEFFLENGVRPAPPDKGSIEAKDLRIGNKAQKMKEEKVDALLELIRSNSKDTVMEPSDAAQEFLSRKMSNLREDSPGNDTVKDKQLVINSGGGDVKIGAGALKNGG